MLIRCLPRNVSRRSTISRLLAGWLLVLCAGEVPVPGQDPPDKANDPKPTQEKSVASPTSSSTDTITLANGCFWCTEAVFQQLKGVVRVKSGYTGGKTKNPTYEQVCTGNTGHAEALQVEFDPQTIPLEVILDVFFHTHDPTTLNRQGHDVGTQYRSGIFYHHDSQREAAESAKKRLEASGVFGNPIVTEITPFTDFYPAEQYHDDYYRLHGQQPYCSAVIRPKVEKVRKEFKDYLK